MDFPFKKTDEGYCELVDYESKIRASVKQILFTVIGERVMLPEFGSRIMSLVHEPINEEMLAQALIESRDALRKWEPRITITDVEIKKMTESGIRFTISYIISGIEEKLEIEETI